MKWAPGITYGAVCALLSTGAAFTAKQANAQDTSGGIRSLEEVVVTARKRDESLLDVPISITSLSAQQIDTYNLQSMEELSRMTPGMFYTDWGGTGRQDRANSQFVVRGLSLNSFQSLSDAALLFIDGVPIVTGNLPGSLDIERIEVLKGPQTAAFGRNTFSGAISVTTRDPAETFEGRVSAEFANYSSSQLALSVEGPLIKDKVFGRISMERRDQGAQYQNTVNGQDLGGQFTQSIWGALKFTPTENLEIKLVANYFEFDDDWGPQVRLVKADANCDPSGSGENTWFCGTVPNVGESDTQFFPLDQRWLDLSRPGFDVGVNSGEPGLIAENVHASAHVTYAFSNGWVFESITGYDEEEEGNIASEWYDPNITFPCTPVAGPEGPAFVTCLLSGGPPNGQREEQSWIYNLQGESKDFSQEIRLSNAGDERLRWSVGANYVLFEQVGGLIGDVPIAPPNAPLALPGGYREATTTSIFGSIYYDLLDNLELGVEGRWQKDEIEDIARYWADNPGAPLTGDWTAFTPRVSLSYKPNDDINVFLTYSEGNRPGAFNSNLLDDTFPAECVAAIREQTGATGEVDQEELESWDLGIKARFNEGRGNATATVYTGTITNQQISQNLTITDPCLVINSFLVNQGEVEFQGVEFDAAYQLTDNLTVSGAFSINDTEVTKGDRLGNLAFGASPDVRGNQLPAAPREQGWVAVAYRDQLSNGMDWYAGADYIYVGSKYITIANLLETGSQELINARIGVETDKWRVELWGKNLADNDTPDLANPSFDYNTFVSQATTIGLARLRTYGIRANYQF